MPSETTITTPIPTSVSRDAVLAALHDHDRYIRTTCPALINYVHISSNPATTPDSLPCEVYEVTDKRPIGQTTFRLTLTDLPGEGIDALIEGKAPTGSMTIKSRFRVLEGAPQNTLEERVAIDSNMLMNKMIKGNVEKSHPEQHQKFMM
ncbi:Polyketide synthase [Apiospora hydei]|uniref:Polyketide synthase n=1 Tax=Apiospora hydei TaxID=1337664 RepID=A0ABR1UR13_9PEZI